jgi:hypothetical protein
LNEKVKKGKSETHFVFFIGLLENCENIVRGYGPFEHILIVVGLPLLNESILFEFSEKMF